MYRQADRFLKKLKAKIRREFNYLSLLGFDELNAVRVKRLTGDAFERLIEFNRAEYRAVAGQVRLYACALLTDEQRKKEAGQRFDADDFVEYALSMYNGVTGYLYNSEAERKRLRLAEEILTAREFQDRKRYGQSLKKAANLWFTQSGQYAIDLADQTAIEIWKRAGITQVRWVAEDDDKTCADCRKRDGRVYEIGNVPTKTHYNCRCIVVPHKG